MQNPADAPDPAGAQRSPTAQSPADAVVLQQVTKLFGRFAALREVSAGFPRGRAYGLFGPNGAGKSTLLRLVAGLARPTRGVVRVLGEREPRRAAARIGYMAHASLLYDELTAMENLRYFARLYGHGEDACREAMARVGLDEKLVRRAGEYSQGMRQRLSLARALVHRPELLLLDEPFSNLDDAVARAVAALLARLRDDGVTLFVVTHQAAHLEDVVHESLRLEAGRLTEREAGTLAAHSAARERSRA